MGGGSKTSKVTEVVTETTTNIRDVGVTGQNAVNLVAALELGSVDREAINAELFSNIVQEQGKNFRFLVGGASPFVNVDASGNAVPVPLLAGGGGGGGIGGIIADNPVILVVGLAALAVVPFLLRK